MLLRWNRATGVLQAGRDEFFYVKSIVRNELNGRRALHKRSEVVRTMPEPGEPYMPRPFPLGTWVVSKPELRSDEYKRPVYIPTNACQEVALWDLDDDGGYDHESIERVVDYGYGLHWSETSSTTLGCGRVATRKQVVRLAAIINLALTAGEEVLLEVYDEPLDEPLEQTGELT